MGGGEREEMAFHNPSSNFALKSRKARAAHLVEGLVEDKANNSTSI